MTILSKKLNILMLDQNETQKGLSESTNIERSTLTKILNGSTLNPKLSTIKTLAKKFNVDIDYLCNDDYTSLNSQRNSLADVLKELLEKYNLTSVALHKHTGVPESVISEILTGKTQKPKLKTLLALTSFFNITPSQLINETFLDINKTSLSYNYVTIPLINIDELTEWIKIKSVNHLTYINIKRKLIGEGSFAIKFNNKSYSSHISFNEIIVFDPEINKLYVNDTLVIFDEDRYILCEYFKTDNDFITLKNLKTNAMLKIEKTSFIHCGIAIQRIVN